MNARPKAACIDALAELTRRLCAKGIEPHPWQRRLWRAAAAGQSGLIDAPTGAGKTLAALGAPVARFLAGKKARTRTCRVLWISPLRALAHDLARGMQELFARIELPLRAAARSGDTSSAERRRQERTPPEVLITTPESLSLLLTRSDWGRTFAGLDTIVVDEWHAVFGSKRGVQVELALATLATTAPNAALWGLSATFGDHATQLDALLSPFGRAGRVHTAPAPKNPRLELLPLAAGEHLPWSGHFAVRRAPAVAERIAELEEGTSALVFVNTRAQAEAWYAALLAAKPEWAGALALHHGSLDRNTRGFVEQGLAAGRWRAVVATSSLDLGVDFAPVALAVQVGSPKGLARLLQRAGRVRRREQGAPRLLLVPTYALEEIEFAAARRALADGRRDPGPRVQAPLDVLVQHAVTRAAGGEGQNESSRSGIARQALWEEVTRTAAFRDLARADFDAALDVATFGGAALAAYTSHARLTAREGRLHPTDARVLRRHRMSLGTIVSDEEVDLLGPGGGRLGRVEEAFAARLVPGDAFRFGGAVLEVLLKSARGLVVRRVRRDTDLVPRYLGGRLPFSSELAASLGELFERVARGKRVAGLTPGARALLTRQARHSGLPIVGECLVERTPLPEGHGAFLYPFAGRHAHAALARLLAMRLTRLESRTVVHASSDWGLVLTSKGPLPEDEVTWRALLSLEGLEADLEHLLGATGLVRRRFTEVARIAGLLPVSLPGRPRRARDLFAAAGLIHDVLVDHEPGSVLLRQARAEAASIDLDRERVRGALLPPDGTLRLVHTTRLGPFAYPLWAERQRESATSEGFAARLAAMARAIGAPVEQALDFAPPDEGSAPSCKGRQQRRSRTRRSPAQ